MMDMPGDRRAPIALAVLVAITLVSVPANAASGDCLWMRWMHDMDVDRQSDGRGNGNGNGNSGSFNGNNNSGNGNGNGNVGRNRGNGSAMNCVGNGPLRWGQPSRKRRDGPGRYRPYAPRLDWNFPRAR